MWTEVYAAIYQATCNKCEIKNSGWFYILDESHDNGTLCAKCYVPAGFKPPFRWDGIAYIWDADNNIAADLDDESRLRARGWGRIQYLDNSDQLMDEWTNWVETTADGSINPDEIVKRFNKEQE
jgi:hypothetical protein